MGLEAEVYLFDIDGTLTRFKDSVREENFLHGNFLLPVLRDIMVERGMSRKEVENGLLRVTKEVPFWDYTDFIAEFDLPVKETVERLWQWHVENIDVYDDTVEMVHKYHDAGKTLLIVSNNPYLGCCLKLKRCGLADEYGSKYFNRILGTDTIRGCKHADGAWKRVLSQIPVDPAKICMVGDNPYEDYELPKQYGVGSFITLRR